jgi:hypothetical protein
VLPRRGWREARNLPLAAHVHGSGGPGSGTRFGGAAYSRLGAEPCVRGVLLNGMVRRSSGRRDGASRGRRHSAHTLAADGRMIRCDHTSPPPTTRSLRASRSCAASFHRIERPCRPARYVTLARSRKSLAARTRSAVRSQYACANSCAKTNGSASGNRALRWPPSCHEPRGGPSEVAGRARNAQRGLPPHGCRD